MPSDAAIVPAAPSRSTTGALPAPSPDPRRVARYALFLLFLVGVFNMVDRQILSVLLEPIRLDLGVSDAAMGVLTGLAFGVFYSLATLPVARLADVHPRRTIMAVGIAFWSFMTAMSGFVSSFWQLAAARVGVGVGEASYIPAGMSMVSDHFPAQRRTLAMAAFTVSMPVGLMTSLALGGWLGETFGWRTTLIMIGVPGLLLAVLVRTTLAEPERGAAEPGSADRALYDIRTTVAYLRTMRSFRNLWAGASLAMFANVSLQSWSTAFLMRVHGVELARAGVMLGPALGVGGVIGVLGGGALTQRLTRSDARWMMWMPALTQLAALPCVVLYLTLSAPAVAVAMLTIATLCHASLNAPLMAAVQGLAKVRMRALAAAVVSFGVSALGAGLGPVMTGALSDRLQPAFGVEALRYALLATAAVGFWAAAHFVAGARSLRGDLARAAQLPRAAESA